MSSGPEIIILVFYIASAFSKPCCDPNVFLYTGTNHVTICENTQTVEVRCSFNLTELYDSYEVANDSRGAFLRHEYLGIIRDPFFCEGLRKGDNDVTEGVALVCLPKAVPAGQHDDKTKDEMFFVLQGGVVIKRVLNVLSALFLATTALVYGILRQVQDTQGICTFHFTLNMCVQHLTIFYGLSAHIDLYYHFCITHLYFFAYTWLSSSIWCSILSFNSWIHVKNQDVVDENKCMKYYRYFGYGIPVIVILICNLNTHSGKLFSEYSLELTCVKHQTALLAMLIALPVVASWISNCFFFFDTQRRLWNYPTLDINNGSALLKKTKYRLVINLKLFFIMGIPWIGLALLNITLLFIDSGFLTICMALFELVFYSEGIFIFLIFVLFRKRVIKAIANNWLTNYNIFPKSWKELNDIEMDDSVVDAPAADAGIN